MNLKWLARAKASESNLPFHHQGGSASFSDETHELIAVMGVCGEIDLTFADHVINPILDVIQFVSLSEEKCLKVIFGMPHTGR